MKTAAAILALAVLLQDKAPEKVSLYWKPPPDRVVVVSLSTTTVFAGREREVAAEAELHPQGEDKDGLSFLIRGTRYAIEDKSPKKGSFQYERGKEPVIQGESPIDAKKALKLKDDIKISISNKGLRHVAKETDEAFEPVSTGILQLQLPPVPVKEGSSWVTLTGLPFKGKLRYTVRSLARGKFAKVEVEVLPEEFPRAEYAPAGRGEYTFSFEDGIISSSSFTTVHKDKNNRIHSSIRQELTQKLKAP